MPDERENDLTAKQQAFVREYLVDLNATQAAIRAGYSPNSADVEGSRLLVNAKVGAAVNDAMEKRAKRTQITADRVLRELAKIGFSDIRKAVAWQSREIVEGGAAKPEEGKLSVSNLALVDSSQIDDDTAAAIAEVSQNAQGGLRIKLHDKRAALVDIGKHLGMFTERVQLSGDADNPVHVVERRIVRPIDRNG